VGLWLPSRSAEQYGLIAYPTDDFWPTLSGSHNDSAAGVRTAHGSTLSAKDLWKLPKGPEGRRRS